MEKSVKGDDIEEKINQIYGSSLSGINWEDCTVDEPEDVRDDDAGIRTHNGFEVPIHGAGRFQAD